MSKNLTPNSVLKTNTDYVLFIRGTNILCSNLDITAKPLSLTPLHLLLIEKFLRGIGIQQAVQEFINSTKTRQLTGNIPADAVVARIAELYRYNILTDSVTEDSDQSNTIEQKDHSFQTEQITYSGNYITHRNLVISFSDKGFVAKFSGVTKVILTCDDLFTLLSIGQTEQIELSAEFKAPHIATDTHYASLNRMIEMGLLVAKPEMKTKPTDEQPKPLSERTSWKELPKEIAKIPVYFVPHTENHYPLALGIIFSAIQDYQDGILLDKFQLVPIEYLSADDLLAGPYRKFGSGVWLFSNYLWSSETNMAMSKFVKNDSPRNITIHGGPSTPDYPHACEEFFTEHSSVDIAIHAEGEIAISQVLSTLSMDKNIVKFDIEQLSDIPGISFRNKKDGVSFIEHTEKRTRMSDPNIIPSPYMAGIFDHYGDEVEAAIIETNRGCPFGCTFCDWGSAINQKVRRFDMDRVKQEIEWIAQHKTKVLWIADANFGMLDRDIEVAKSIIEMKTKYGFPQEVVVNYTKNTTERLVEIIKIFTDGGIISQGIISIQSMDAQTLEVIDRKNIKLSKYEELRKIFSDLKLPLSTDLMLGLPGTTMKALKNDLQHYIDADVPVKAYPTQLLPNSPMAAPDYMKKYEIETYDDGFLKSTYSYTEAELTEMKGLYKTFTMADGYGLLRYVIRYLQWEYHIKAIDFIHTMMLFIKSKPLAYPALSFATVHFDTEKLIPGGWDEYYSQLKGYILEQYSVVDNSSLDAILLVNKLAMPDEALSYPLKVELEHDVVAYFKAQQDETNTDIKCSLSSLPPGHITVSDPDGIVNIDAQFLQYDSHQFFWELETDISRIRSAFTM